MPFTEEQMKQIFDTNIIDFAVQNGFQIEKGDRYTVYVKNSGGLYLFNHGRGYYCFSTQIKGNSEGFTSMRSSLQAASKMRRSSRWLHNTLREPRSFSASDK